MSDTCYISLQGSQAANMLYTVWENPVNVWDLRALWLVEIWVLTVWNLRTLWLCIWLYERTLWLCETWEPYNCDSFATVWDLNVLWLWDLRTLTIWELRIRCLCETSYPCDWDLTTLWLHEMWVSCDCVRFEVCDYVIWEPVTVRLENPVIMTLELCDCIRLSPVTVWDLRALWLIFESPANVWDLRAMWPWYLRALSCNETWEPCDGEIW